MSPSESFLPPSPGQVIAGTEDRGGSGPVRQLQEPAITSGDLIGAELLKAGETGRLIKTISVFLGSCADAGFRS